MKVANRITFAAFAAFVHFSYGETPPPVPLSEDEAMAIVEAQRDAHEIREAERKARILQAEAISEQLLTKGERQTVLRRVGWQAIEPLKAAAAKNPSQPTEAFITEIEDYEHSMISMSATVFDDSVTRVTWRDPGVSGAEPITVWTNVNFKYLRPISNWEDNGVHYSYFGLTSEVDTEAYFTHPETGEKIYPATIPDWIPETSDFPEGAVSYLVLVDEAEAAVPELLYQQMDALLRYFAEYEPELLVMHQRSEALQKAREELEKTRPTPEKDIVINYWPIQSNTDF